MGTNGKGPTKAAMYLRVSTEDQAEKFGLDVQRERCEAMAKVKGWDVATTFADEGLSGALDVTERPGLRDMLGAAEKGDIDAVIVAALDRLGRQTRIVLSIAEQLERMQVEMVSCRESLDTETPAGQFVLTLFAGMAQWEKDTIRERTMSGLVSSARNGNVITAGSNAPYGYDVVERDGNRTLAINEAEAEVVRLIFRVYASGEETIAGLARYLTEQGIPTPAKGRNHEARRVSDEWARGSLHNLLNNETYVGRWYFRKTKRVKQPNGKYTQIERPRSEWILVEVPAIVDEQTFKLVQKRRDANARQLRKRRYNYALGGMLTCGRCGSGISGITFRHSEEQVYRYYICNARRRAKADGSKCDMPNIRVEELDATVWGWISRIVMKPESLRKSWEEYQAEVTAELQPLTDMVEANEEKIAELQAEKQRLVRAYARGVLTLDDIAEQKTDLERAIEQYTKANEEMRADVDRQMPSEADFESIEAFASEMALGAVEGAEGPDKHHDLYRKIHMDNTLIHNGEEHFIDVSCILGKERLSTASTMPT